ncbi:MAG: ABC transporter ATP-binding protein [Nitrospirota bacterium]
MTLTLTELSKTFRTLRGTMEALRQVTLRIEDSEFFVLLGPSGCGKSTTLNLVAGLERPTAGEIRFGDRIVASSGRKIFVPPRDRNVAMVFQSYALYPHLSVFDNIAFPLKIAKTGTAEIKRSVARVAELLGIHQLLERKPRELSGGQRQRVSIARALVRNPEVFLLDEPLSNLDAQLRTATRGELKRLQRETGITTLYVTHDQVEAMTLGDRVGLFRDGRLEQVGSPEELYRHPQTAFAATFIGSPPMNLLPVEVVWEEGAAALIFPGGRLALPPQREHLLTRLTGRYALLGIRPENIKLSPPGDAGALLGRVVTVEHLGREVLYRVSTMWGELFALEEELRYGVDDNVQLFLDPTQLHLFEPEPA